jgi:hypothetical protein
MLPGDDRDMIVLCNVGDDMVGWDILCPVENCNRRISLKGLLETGDEIGIRLEIFLDYPVSMIEDGGRQVNAHEDSTIPQQFSGNVLRQFSGRSLLPSGPLKFPDKKTFIIHEMADIVPVVGIPDAEHMGTSVIQVRESMDDA